MYLTDFHIHSSCSGDADDTMLNMARASAEAGISHICFTDHCDLDHYLTGLPNPDCAEVWNQALLQYDELKRDMPAGLEASLGLELGAANHNPAFAAKIAAAPELDFVIGAVHNLRDTPDFFGLKYQSEEHCLELMDAYVDDMLELAGLSCYDVMAHIGYAHRYMTRAGFDVELTLERYGDKLEALFKTLISGGRGIELNFSGLRGTGRRVTYPSLPVLSLYRSLGGELLTVGSDAHRVSEAGVCLKQAHELLGAAGVKYLCVYRQRKPEFFKF